MAPSASQYHRAAAAASGTASGTILGETSHIYLGGDPDFTKLTGLVRYTVPLFDAFSFAGTAQGQYSFDPLIEGEQMLFGGTQIGRGYETDEANDDGGRRGLNSTSEIFIRNMFDAWLGYMTAAL